RQSIRYDVELRDRVTGKVTPYSTPREGLIQGKVAVAIDDDDTSLVIEANTLSPPPSMSFPRADGIIDIAGEKIFYQSYNPSTLTFTGLERGYDGTTPAAHGVGQFVTALSMGLTLQALLPGRDYEVRV